MGIKDTLLLKGPKYLFQAIPHPYRTLNEPSALCLNSFNSVFFVYFSDMIPWESDINERCPALLNALTLLECPDCSVKYAGKKGMSYLKHELSSLRSQLGCWPALARVVWDTMLSLQYLGSRSHKIQPLQARSGPGVWAREQWNAGTMGELVLLHPVNLS